MNERPNEQIEEQSEKKAEKKRVKRTRKERKAEKYANKDIKRTLVSRFDLLNRFKHWYMGGISITRSMFRVRAAWQGVIIICSILMVLFILSAFYTGAGEFVISLDSSMSEDGFYLSNTLDFAERTVCIRSEAVVADNISIFDISEDVPNLDGLNSGSNYVAHTFYLANSTGNTKDYQYSLNIRQSEKNADKALWVMVYQNGKQKIYAKIGDDKNPEKQYSIYPFPFEEDAADVAQYQKVSGDEAGISTSEVNQAQSIVRANKLTAVPFESDRVICSGERENIKNNEIDKYTVVMWYEGEDPDCTDEIIGGWVEVYMEYEYMVEKDKDMKKG